MIQVVRDGTALVVKLDHGLLNNDGCLLLRWDATTELLADALVRQVRDLVCTRIKEVREEEYLKGYKDGRGHKPKKDWFWSVLKKEN